jgi:IS605 OrfB family transposase
MKGLGQYNNLPALAAQQTMKIVERSFRSFFGLLKKKQGGNYNRPVKIPGYLPKDGYFVFVYPILEDRCGKGEFVLRVPKELQSKFSFKEFRYPVPPTVTGKVKEVRILPKNNAKWFEIEFVYEAEEEKYDVKKSNVLSIDPGVDNFATCLSNTGKSFILDGREMKSINQYYNKQKSKVQSVYDKQNIKYGNKMFNLGNKRRRQLGEYLNQYVNLIVQVCLAHKIGKVVIGEGWHAQESVNHGNVNNQNFVMLPFGKFVWKLQAKCQLNGIEFLTQNEAYTSKCDHLAGEKMCHNNKYLGKRSPWGLFKSSTGKVLNADVNGALGIMIKSTGKRDIVSRLNSGTVTVPRRIRLREIQQTSSMRLAQNIFGLIQAPPLAVG